jgi:CheY-like chemotaxis protein
MNGIEALGVLRADPATATIPVIAVTASVMQQDRKLITDAGFDRLRRHSRSTLKEFLDAVAGMLARKRAMSDTAKVLVVDDTPLNIKLLGDLLAVKGYSVTTAANGEEALKRLAAEVPDIVLPRCDDARTFRLRCLQAHSRGSRNGAPARRHDHLARSATGTGSMETRPGQMIFLSKPIHQPAGTVRARAFAFARQSIARRSEATSRGAQRVEREARGARAGASGRGAAAVATEALSFRLRSRKRSSPRGSNRSWRRIGATSATSFSIFAAFTAFYRLGRARGSSGRSPRLITPRWDTLVARARRHARSLRWRRNTRILQRSTADTRPGQARRAHGVGHAGPFLVKSRNAGRSSGTDLDLGIGIASGYATVGAFGFEGRWDYTAIGSVVATLADRLCREAKPAKF